MTRAEADRLLQQYDDARNEWRMYDRRESGSRMCQASWQLMNAIRERIIGNLCDDVTEPMAGRAP